MKFSYNLHSKWLAIHPGVDLWNYDIISYRLSRYRKWM